MTRDQHHEDGELTPESIRAAETVADIAGILRRLRRRDARNRGDSQLTYRELAAKTGWAHGVIGDYFSGRTLAPTDRFDALVRLLGAAPHELGPLATARDRAEEGKRRSRSVATSGVPHQLPAPAAGFVGRQAALADAVALLGGGAGRGTRIIAICGTAGVGKTALALQMAGQIQSGFPGGSLYVDLRGYGSAEPMSPEAALIGFLRSLGASEPDTAAEVGELAARFRSLVADRRVIIMLDNARNAEQVRPLLPGTSTSLVLVTSRDHLAGLVARDGAVRIVVPLLPMDEAVQLLHTLIGTRVAQDRPAAEDLAGRCARLPLALRIAAELAVRRPCVAIADLVGELDAAPQSLDLLDAGGDTETAVRQIFSWSDRHLSPGAAAAFRLLGTFPGTEFEPAALAALAAIPRDQAQRHIDELVRTSLVEQRPANRYTMHDLLRAYARELATPDPDTTDRLLRHYLGACGEAVATVYPAEVEGSAVSTSAAGSATAAVKRPGPSTTAAQEALAWLDAELPNLVALSDQAIHNGQSEFATAVSQRLWPYLDRRGRYPEAMAIHGNALSAARTLGDARLEAAALGELGQANARLGRYREALDRLHQALTLSREAGDRARAATTLNSLSIAYSRLGRSEEAIEHLLHTVDEHRALGNRVAEGKALSNLGIEYAQLGQYQKALHHFGSALDIARQCGDRYGEGNALNNLGLVSCWLGRYEDALRHHEAGLACARGVGDHAGEGRVLANLGVNHTRIGNHRSALACLKEALRIHEEVGDRAAVAEALTYLGDLNLATGDPAGALRQHQQALSIAQSIGYQHVQAPAHNGAGRALWALDRLQEAAGSFDAGLQAAEQAGDRLQRAHALAGLARVAGLAGLAGLADFAGLAGLAQRDRGQDEGAGRARELWQRAAAIYAELGVPELYEAREQLNAELRKSLDHKRV